MSKNTHAVLEWLKNKFLISAIKEMKLYVALWPFRKPDCWSDLKRDQSALCYKNRSHGVPITYFSKDSCILVMVESDNYPWDRHVLSSHRRVLDLELFRNDRVGKGGGGVAIYLSSRIPAKILYSSFSHHGCMEHLFQEIDIRGNKVILGVVYCPPSIDYFSDLEVLIDSCAIDYNHHIIMGDFNTDLLINSPSSRKLRSLITSANFSFLHLNPSHHNLNTSDSWFDHIIVSSSDRVVKFGQISAPCFSRHDLIYIAYDVKPPKSKPKMVSIRNFARMDTERLERDASLIDWSPIREMPSANDMVTYFNTEVLKLFDKHAPIKKVKVRRPPAP
ncbi:hypothetical protein evm_006125 [Chilo suppressalis]|nr:hypothetical protein evm_006125 [Chilo suppressalis]